MVKAWYKRIIDSNFEVNIDSVPAVRKNAVLMLLNEDGLNGYGEKI